MERLPNAQDVIFSNVGLADLHRHIRLHVRAMRNILRQHYALREIGGKLPHDPKELTHSRDEEVGFTAVEALTDQIDLGLAKLFDTHSAALSFNRILKEYRGGSHDTKLADKIENSIKTFVTEYSGLLDMRNNELAHQDPRLELNVFQSFVRREEAIRDALNLLDLFVVGGKSSIQLLFQIDR